MSTPKKIKRVLALIIDYESHSEAEALSLQLARLRPQNYALDVVHVDNASPTPHTPSPSQQEAGVHCLRLKENHGYAGGLNETVTQFDPEGAIPEDPLYEAYWFLNSDFWIEADCLDRLVEVFDQEPRVAAVGPRILKGDGPKVWGARGSVSPWLGLTAMGDWPQGGPLPRWSYLPGCSLLTRSAPYRELRGLPSRYRLYFEETEYCVRLQKLGYELWVERSAIAHHRVASIQAGVPARHFAFYFARNNLYFWQNCFGIPWFIQVPRTVFTIVKELVLPLRRARTWAEFTDRLYYVFSGFIDGFEFLHHRFTRRERKLFLEEKPR